MEGGNTMTLVDFLTRMSLSFFFGGVIGFERQKRQRLAGMRTNVLVCLGACLFVSLAMFWIESQVLQG